LIEYGVVLGLVSAAGISTVLGLGGQAAEIFTEAGAELYSNIHQDPLDPNAFAIMVIGDEATLYPSAGGAIEVDWGDREANGRCGNVFTAGSSISCRYQAPGTYRVSISGDMTSYGDLSGEGGGVGIVRVLQWGSTGLKDLSYAFYGASNLIDVPPALPPGTTSLRGTFFGASSFNDPDIAAWDTSSVVNFFSTFEFASSFNVDISEWDVSSATDMHHIFFRAESFNQDIGGWDVSGVTSFRGAFRAARAFSYSLGDWDTSGATTFRAMFYDMDYNHDLSGWDTSSATAMDYMFSANATFDQDISGWDVSSVEQFSRMFAGNTAFNQDISGWDTSAALSMDKMFEDAAAFSGDLSEWCVPNIPTRPASFSDGAPMAAEPAWGSCP